ncbi:hypothetical protein ZWY2020_021074 [Hordeum vulgare]|nr:hypothetical protein ZWY2020_021074 [Hordeum vulgare]
MDLLHSTPANVYGEELPEFVAGGAGGSGRGVGAGQRTGRGGRAGVDHAGRSGGGHRGRSSGSGAGRGGHRGRVPVLGSEEAAGGRGGGRGRGVGRSGQTVRPSSLPYRAPRASSGSIEIEGVTTAEHEPEDSNFSDQYYDGIGDDESNDDIDKAEWTNSENTAAFCSLCVEEIIAGNRSNGFMTARGRSPSGGIVASDEFWKKHTKGHAAWRKLKYGPPENLSELEIMFKHTAVDGSTSIVPGEHMDDEGDIGEEGGDEADMNWSSDDLLEYSSSDDGVVSLYGSDVEDDTVNFARQTLKRHATVAYMIGMYYEVTFLQDKKMSVHAEEGGSGYDWTIRTCLE